jgi:hypothetical protein
MTSPVPALQPQLDEISVNIPDAIGSRIKAGAAEIDASGVAPGLAVGEPAPNFTLPDALGQLVTLADLLAHGPVVVVFTGASGAPTATSSYEASKVPCRAFASLVRRLWPSVPRPPITAFP